MGDSQDYVWHFKLRAEPGASPDEPEAAQAALTAMVARQIQALLRCVVLTSDGEDLKVTGFRFLDQGGTEHALRGLLEQIEDDGPAGS